MNKLKAAILLMMLFSSICMAGMAEGIPSAVQWLKVVDSGEYEQSWNKAAPFFQTQISNRDWAQALEKARKPLGKVVSREVINSSLHKSLPGVPDGEYIVVILSTSFEQQSSAVETVTMSKTDDGWRAIGYFIK